MDQMKLVSGMMKNMSPDQMQELMKQAQDSKKMLEEQIRTAVQDEIRRLGLVSREEVERMIREAGKN